MGLYNMSQKQHGAVSAWGCIGVGAVSGWGCIVV